jgi:hypothetical protein
MLNQINATEVRPLSSPQLAVAFILNLTLKVPEDSTTLPLAPHLTCLFNSLGQTVLEDISSCSLFV